MSKVINITLLGKVIEKIHSAIVAAISKASSEFNEAIGKKVDDAPADGKAYIRQDNAWKEADKSSVEFATEEEVDEILNKVFGEDETAE